MNEWYSKVIVVGCGVSEVNIMENDEDVIFCERDLVREGFMNGPA